jgi:hypothetical protein
MVLTAAAAALRQLRLGIGKHRRGDQREAEHNQQ